MLRCLITFLYDFTGAINARINASESCDGRTMIESGHIAYFSDKACGQGITYSRH